MTPHPLRVCTVAAILATGALLAVTASALASYPGSNGRIAFAHDPGPMPQYDIFNVNPDGSDPVQLTTDPGTDTRPAYSADGERIVYSHRPEGASEFDIWVMNHDGSGQTPLTSGPATDDDAQFSPDGGRIVFERTTGAGIQIFAMDADGSNVTQLTFGGPGNNQSTDPTFSPDGSRIFFSRRPSAMNISDIWVMNPDGTGQTQLTTATSGTGDVSPSVSPNGQLIAVDHFTAPPPVEDVFVMNADGSGPRQVTSGPGQDIEPVFSPDGTRIAFERQSNTYSLGDIVLTDAGGLDQNVTPLTQNPTGVYDSSPDWQPLNPPNCDLSGTATQKSVKSVSVIVTCQNENTSVVAEGAGSAPKVPKGAAASKKKRFTIPAVTQQVQPNTPATVTLTIPKKGSKTLKRAQKAGRKGKATITATVTDDLGQSETESFQVTFKAKKKKKKK